jgi:hypothetical protein
LSSESLGPEEECSFLLFIIFITPNLLIVNAQFLTHITKKYILIVEIIHSFQTSCHICVMHIFCICVFWSVLFIETWIRVMYVILWMSNCVCTVMIYFVIISDKTL